MSKRRGQGEGSIYKMSDGRWRAAVDLGYRNGNRIRKVYTAPTKHEVQEALKKALRDQQRGIPLAPEKQTVEQFLQHWLENVAKSRVRPSTYSSYQWIVEKHLVPGIGRIALSKLTPQQVQTLLNDRLEATSLKDAELEQAHRKRLSGATVQHIHAVLRAALEQALKWDLVARNVAELVDAPRVSRREAKPFTPEQARKFLEAARGDRLEGLYAVAMLGLRRGEILGLQWPDLDFHSATLTVRHALQRIGGELKTVDTKTERSRRTIRLPQVTIEALLRHCERQQQDKQFAGDRWKTTGFVFTTSIGTPLDGPTVTHRFQKLLQQAALPRIRFHDLRHTCATLLLSQGVHPRVVMEILGHSQIGITMNLYSHVLPAMQQEVALQLDRILAPVATSLATKPAPDTVN